MIGNGSGGEVELDHIDIDALQVKLNSVDPNQITLDLFCELVEILNGRLLNYQTSGNAETIR